MPQEAPPFLRNKLETPDRDVLLRPSSAGAPNVFTDTEDHALVQHRLGLTYGLFTLIIVGFYVMSTAFIAVMMPARFAEITLSPAKMSHVAGGLLLGGVWLVCRGKPRPRGMLAAIDLAASFQLSLMMAAMVGLAPPGLRAEMMGSIGFVLSVCLRAALVPSPPRWTALVAVISAVPVPIAAYVCALHDPSWPVDLVPRSATIMLALGWCAAGTATALAISRVVYGLRSEVKTAMRLGQYTLEDKIGEGGMGTVYRARHALLRRPTAIKLLALDKAGVANAQRFEREVQLTSKLTHPNTIAIYDYGHTRTGVFYYAMELIDGLSLQELCEEDGPQPPGRVVHIVAQVASALAEAHGVGLIHRDVKPANILLSSRGGLPDFAKVCDFGLVKEIDSPDPSLSHVNAIAGTPLYMAPESITRPEAVDAHVDLYALGCVTYWLLTGHPPFEGSNLIEICSHHVHTVPQVPSTRAPGPVPDALDALVMKCLEKKPEARPVSARALAAELRAMQEECPWSEDDANGWWSARASRKSQQNAAVAALSPTVPAGEKPRAHPAAI